MNTVIFLALLEVSCLWRATIDYEELDMKSMGWFLFIVMVLCLVQDIEKIIT